MPEPGDGERWRTYWRKALAEWPELAETVAAWPTLPEPIRAAIAALIRSAGSREQGR